MPTQNRTGQNMDTTFLDADIDRLNEIDRTGVITDEDKKRFAGIHFCPDWDFMAVTDNSSEKSGCTCNPEKKATKA